MAKQYNPLQSSKIKHSCLYFNFFCTTSTSINILKWHYCRFASALAFLFPCQQKLLYHYLSPSEPPGKVIDLKVTGSTYNTLSISWTKPKEVKDEHDEAKGYFVEIRPAESIEWNRCNTNATIITFYTVKGLKSLAIYWVRVIAVNEGGAGEPTELNNYIIATPPPGMSLDEFIYFTC